MVTVHVARILATAQKRRFLWAGLSALLSSCVFFELELDPCFDAQPPMSCMGGDGNGGDPAEVTGGRGGKTSKPPPGEAGSEGNGGSPIQMGGAGGLMAGAPGLAWGGSNGAGGGVGGSAADGGSGGALTPVVLRINEIKVTGGRFLELYNAGQSLALAGQLTVRSGATAGDSLSCMLPVDVEVGDRLVLVPEGVGCPTASGGCVECSLDLSAGPPAVTLSLVDAAGLELQAVTYPDPTGVGAPLATQSWAAIPDGSAAFRSAPPSPGALNVQR